MCFRLEDNYVFCFRTMDQEEEEGRGGKSGVRGRKVWRRAEGEMGRGKGKGIH